MVTPKLRDATRFRRAYFAFTYDFTSWQIVDGSKTARGMMIRGHFALCGADNRTRVHLKVYIH